MFLALLLLEFKTFVFLLILLDFEKNLEIVGNKHGLSFLCVPDQE